MPQGYYRQVTEVLRKHGFKKTRGGKGSHEKWRHGSGKLVIMSHNMKSRHTANDIGETRRHFRAHLMA